MDPVIDYAPQPRRRGQFRKWAVPAAIAVAGLVVVSFILGTEVRHDLGWVCASCGSRRSEVNWVVGGTTSRTMNTSALAKWLADRSLPHAHDWRNVKGTGRNLLGGSMSRGHGRAPPIYPMAFDTLLDDYLKRATEAEVLEFARVLRHGTEAEQEAAVEAAATKVLGQ